MRTRKVEEAKLFLLKCFSSKTNMFVDWERIANKQKDWKNWKYTESAARSLKRQGGMEFTF